MANNGLQFDGEVSYTLVTEATVSSSGDGDPTYSHSASLTSYWVPDIVQLLAGVTMTAGSTWDGSSGTWYATYTGPGTLGTITASGTSYRSNVSVSIVFQDLKLYQRLTGSLYYWSATPVLYVNGSLHSTLSGGAYQSEGVSPSHIPAIGIPPVITGGCTGGRTNLPSFTWDACSPSTSGYTWTTDVEQTVTGSFLVNNDTLPITFPTSSVPTGDSSCKFGIGLGSPAATDTGTVELTNFSLNTDTFSYEGRVNTEQDVFAVCANIDEPGDNEPVFVGKYATYCLDPCDSTYKQGYRDTYKLIANRDSAAYSAFIWPNLETGVVKQAFDLQTYNALWYRLQMPTVNALSSRSCTASGVTTSWSDTDEIYTGLSVFLENVTDSTSDIEDIFQQMKAPWTGGRTKSKTTTYTHYGPTVCVFPPPGVPSINTICPAGGGWAGGTIYPALPENDLESETVGYSYPSSVSSYSDYLYHNEDIPRLWNKWFSQNWNVMFYAENYLSEDWATYWGPNKQQWFGNPSLPSGEKTEKIAHNVFSPIQNDQGHQPFLDTFAGGLRWLGISRFQVDEWDIPTTTLHLSETVSGQWAWDTENVTVSFSSTGLAITATEPGWVELTLKSWTTKPFLKPVWHELIHLNTSSTGLVFKGVTLDGAKQELVNDHDSWYQLKGTGKLYAGTWANYEGTDTKPHGTSAVLDGAAFVDIPLGTSIEKVRIEVPVGNSFLHWPSFKTQTNWEDKVYWITSKAYNLLKPNYGGLHLQQLTNYSPGFGWLSPPVATDDKTPHTIIDTLAMRRYLIEGIDGLDGLTTELSTRYDSFEGQSIAVVDKFSVGMLLEKDGNKLYNGLISSLAEGPPLSAFPVKKRNTTWADSSQYWAGVYDWSYSDKLLTCNYDIRFSVGAASTAPSGWYIWKYNPVFTVLPSTETISLSGSGIASAYNNFGYHCVYNPAATGIAFTVDIAKHRNLTLVRTWCDGTDIYYGYSNSWPVGYVQQIVYTGKNSRVAVRSYNGKQLEYLLVLDETDNLLLKKQNGYGGITMATISTTSQFADIVFSENNLLYVFYEESGVLKCKQYNPEGTLLGSWTTDVSDVTGQLSVETFSLNGKQRFVMDVFINDNLETLISENALNFTSA